MNANFRCILAIVVGLLIMIGAGVAWRYYSIEGQLAALLAFAGFFLIVVGFNNE